MHKKRDLTFAKEKAAEELERLSRQEVIVNNSRAQGISVKPDNELLIHLYDLNRRMIDRVKTIEAALDVKVVKLSGGLIQPESRHGTARNERSCVQ